MPCRQSFVNSCDATPGLVLALVASYCLHMTISGPERGARTRAPWDEYFMNIAREVSTRSTCDRKFVGAVIVRDKSILATGYNGSIRGLAHCDEEGHLMEDGHCVRTVHAEANAIVQAARHGVRIEGASIYVTASPCWGCFRLMANAGIARVCFGEFYRDKRIFDVATTLGIELVDMSATSCAGGTSTREGKP
jgi:dCMP deaminase